MKFELTIINRLLDRYEGSKQSYSEVSKPSIIRLNVKTDKCFADYWRDDAYNFRPDIENAVVILEKNKFVTSIKDRNSGLLNYVILNENNIDAVFKFAKRVKKTDLIAREIGVLETFLKTTKKDSVLESFCKAMIERLSERKPHKEYFDNEQDLAIKCRLIDEIEINDEEVLLRNFSKKKFSDSKLVERHSAFLLKVFNEFDTFYDSFTALCENYYIVKNHGYAYIKNGLAFKINNQVINLDDLKEEFSLSDSAIEKMAFLSISKSKILTIENLTTFHYFNNPDFVVIYLGGFHNSTKRKLIEKINNYNPLLEWFHFGDIDWGGFQILIDLREKTKVIFKPYLMDITQLKKYKSECINLTKNDIKKLKQLSIDHEEFRDLIQFMLANDIKLEQESIEFY